MTERVPRRSVILIVDDEEEQGKATKTLLGSAVSALNRLPGDVTLDELRAADLVMVDYRIENWEERDALQTPSLQPQDGLALIATLRSNLAKPPEATPTAFALRSGRLEDITGGYQYSGREHVLARLYNLEWVFAKSGDDNLFGRQAKCLADGVRRLPSALMLSERRKVIDSDLLALPVNASWKHSAEEDIERAFPPEDIEYDATRGMALVRWLLHEVFPYPGPLLDYRYLSARLFIEPEHMIANEYLHSNTALRRALRQFEFKGIMAGFDGPRWWRAGIESWLWKKTNGRALDKQRVINALDPYAIARNAFTTLVQPVVIVDDQYRPTKVLIEITNAVQLNPDQWPSWAGPAWAQISEVSKDVALKARVDSRDESRVLRNEKSS
jgi:hypothetical protein